MAFDTLQVEATEGLLGFAITIVHRQALSTWRKQESEIGKSEMKNLKLTQPTKVTFYSSSDL